MRLKDRVALITGAGRGIGEAIALAFKREGARVAVADIDARTAATTARRLGSRGLALQMDVASKTSVDEGFAILDEKWGRVDIAVANAAIEPIVPFLELDEDTWDRIVDTNLKGTFLVAQAAARRMVRRRSGVIITLSSVNAEVARPESAAYAATKGGVRQLTKAMAISLAPHAIRVNAVGPGTIQTPLLDGVIKDAAFRTKVLSRTPIGRFGQPDEVAAIVAWLASEESSYVTGTTVYADGGRLPLNYVVPVRE